MERGQESDDTLSMAAIVEQMDTTTVVPPGARLRNDRLGYLHIALDPLHGDGGT